MMDFLKESKCLRELIIYIIYGLNYGQIVLINDAGHTVI
jgi:hypothetical protein